jgi:sialate O-acetylesterase
VKGEALNGFTVCGEDKVFHPAKATLQGDTVVVTSDKVAKPVAVRFGWVNFAKAELNLFSKNGLPAVPFRTDTFPPTTK